MVDRMDSRMEVESDEEDLKFSAMDTSAYSSAFCPISAATNFVSATLFSQPSQELDFVALDESARAKEGANGKPCSKCKQKSTTQVVADETFAPDRNQNSSVDTVCLENVRSELVCSICQQFFVEACTVECGHSFCRMCIDNWLKTKLSCPVCRHPVQKPPVASLCLDKAINAILESTHDEERTKELHERKRQACEARASECFSQSCLETLFRKAVEQGVRVVHISKRWSPREQHRFLCGIERHQGVAREAYCKLVGLTYEWVGRATMEELLVAATNVQLRDLDYRPRPSNEWKDTCILKVRSRLEMYIRYG